MMKMDKFIVIQGGLPLRLIDSWLLHGSNLFGLMALVMAGTIVHGVMKNTNRIQALKQE